MKTKLVIFDFSGTLAYSRADGQNLIEGINDLGFKTQASLEIDSFYPIVRQFLDSAKSWQDLAEKISFVLDKETDQRNVKKLAELLQKSLGFKLYDDAQEAFNLPVQKAILTTGSHFLLNNCGLPEDIRIFTPLETRYLKPDPRAFLFVLEQMGIDPQQAMMVGDETERDLIPAVDLGMKAFLIDRGSKNIDDLPNGITKINSLKKLSEYAY